MTHYPATLPSTLESIPAGAEGVRRTLRAMVKFAREGRRDVGVVQLARSIVLPLPPRDYAGQVRLIFQWVKKNIRYVNDPRTVETLATAQATLKMSCGDCDDMSTLTASLLEAVGHPTRFAALGFNRGPYSHVIVETKLGSQWAALDTTVAESTVGWKPRDITRVMIAHV